MRILHTSDWHLGQKLLYHDRRIEHQLALDWLINTIEAEQVEILLVSGDIFDTGNPPNYARRMYYQFLRRVTNTVCRHVVITAGNHDSPAMLGAPQDLLEILNVRVVSRANTENVNEELIPLKNKVGELEAVIAAVPFLRDQDLRKSVSAETAMERKQAIRKAIKLHFEAVGEAAQIYVSKNVPIIAMGHLYVKEAVTNVRHDNIYIGDKANIEAAGFPQIFDYVALGHIHRPQQMKGTAHVQYSGSIIPLSFSETIDEKVVKILDFEGRNFKLQDVKIPVFRRLKTIEKDNLEALKSRLVQLAEDYKDGLSAWVEIILNVEKSIPDLDVQLTDLTKDMNLEILKVRTNYPTQNLANSSAQLNLQDLEPIQVFEKKLDQTQVSPTERQELLDTFKELQNWITDTDKD